MINKKIMIIVGLETISIIGIMLLYGKREYNRGRINAAREINNDLKKIREDFTKKYWKKRFQEALIKERES